MIMAELSRLSMVTKNKNFVPSLLHNHRYVKSQGGVQTLSTFQQPKVTF